MRRHRRLACDHNSVSSGHLAANAFDCVAQYAACGLDPENHTTSLNLTLSVTELAWVLTCLTPIGELQRMTRPRDKAAKLGFKTAETEEGEVKFTHDGARPQASINAGPLCHPVPTAADILLYNADLVPVGEDQRQHMELCRDLAQRFNHQFSDTFTILDAYALKTGAKIMSLTEPTKNVEVGRKRTGHAYVLDEPDQIKKKIDPP